jgi:hypothetical protein
MPVRDRITKVLRVYRLNPIIFKRLPYTTDTFIHVVLKVLITQI